MTAVSHPSINELDKKTEQCKLINVPYKLQYIIQQNQEM